MENSIADRLVHISEEMEMVAKGGKEMKRATLTAWAETLRDLADLEPVSHLSKPVRAFKVYAMRVHDRKTFVEIGTAMGVSRQRAYQLYEQAKKRLKYQPELLDQVKEES